MDVIARCTIWRTYPLYEGGYPADVLGSRAFPGLTIEDVSCCVTVEDLWVRSSTGDLLAGILKAGSLEDDNTTQQQ